MASSSGQNQTKVCVSGASTSWATDCCCTLNIRASFKKVNFLIQINLHSFEESDTDSTNPSVVFQKSLVRKLLRQD